MRKNTRWKYIDELVEAGAKVTIRCKDRKQMQYLRIYFYQGKGWRVRTDSKTLKIKVEKETKG